MIAIHQEPKGLAWDTPALRTREHDVSVRKAVRGSRRLRNAILIAQGLKPPRARPRNPSPQICETCSTPLRPSRQLIAGVQQSVAAYYGLNFHAMSSADRRRCVSWPRQVAMYLASELTVHSISEIGRRFNRDHTTVLHAIKVVPLRAEVDAEAAFDIALLRERLAA